LRGPGLDDQGPAPRAATLAAGRSGFDHALVLLAPGGLLKLANRRSAPLTLFAAGAGGEGFDVTVPAGGTAEARLAAPGRYEVHCEEDPALEAEVLVAETTWAQSGRAGDALCFDRLPPGRYEVIATAPRLPQWTGHVEAAAGARATVHAELSVNRLPPAARP
jgi:hypothetical protein